MAMESNSMRRQAALSLLLGELYASAVVPAAVCAQTPSASGASGLVPSDGAVSWIVVSPAYARTGIVVAGTIPQSTDPLQPAQIWVSHDGGSSWRAASGTHWDESAISIALDAAGTEVLLAGSNAGLEESRDYGETWQRLGTGLGMPSPLPTYAQDEGIAVASSKGDYVVRNGRSHAVKGSDGTAVDAAFGYPTGSTASGPFSAPLLGALDRSSSHLVVMRCSAALECNQPADLPGVHAQGAGLTLHFSADSIQDGTVFVQTGDEILKSVDGGAHFAALTVSPRGDAIVYGTPAMALAPGYREGGPTRRVYVAVAAAYMHATVTGSTGGGLFRSDDGGATWAQLHSSALDRGVTAVAAAPDGRLFAGYMTGQAGHGGLACSDDGGATWQPTCPPIAVPGRRCTSVACGAQPTAARVIAVDTPPDNGILSAVLFGAGVVVLAGMGGAWAMRRMARRRRPNRR